MEAEIESRLTLLGTALSHALMEAHRPGGPLKAIIELLVRDRALPRVFYLPVEHARVMSAS